MLFRIQNVVISLLLLSLFSSTVHVHATRTADNSTNPDRRAGVGDKRPVSRGKTRVLQSFSVGYAHLSHMLTAFLSLSKRQVLKLASLEAAMPKKDATLMPSRSWTVTTNTGVEEPW
jgi:hypothetical protein